MSVLNSVAHFDQDRAGITLRTLSSARERKQALDIFGRVIQHPEFAANVLEREKARVIAGIEEKRIPSRDNIADRTLMKMLYGSHPYGLRGSGEIDSVSALRREDLVEFISISLFRCRCGGVHHGRSEPCGSGSHR